MCDNKNSYNSIHATWFLCIISLFILATPFGDSHYYIINNNITIKGVIHHQHLNSVISIECTINTLVFFHTPRIALKVYMYNADTDTHTPP